MKQKCSICGKEFEGYGNNPEPLMSYDEGRCCDECNAKVVQYRTIGKELIRQCRQS